MIVLHIEGVKEFMEQLFYGDMFDRFHVKDCEVATFTVFRIDGRRQDEWYDTDEREGDGTGFVTWNQLKPYVAEWIKGKKKPRKMEMNFCHYMKDGDVGSLRVHYEKEQLHLYTGYMQKEFLPDKEKQQQWDENCRNFIRKNKIVSTQIS